MDVRNRMLLIRIISGIHKAPEFAARAGIKDKSFVRSTDVKDPKEKERVNDGKQFL